MTDTDTKVKEPKLKSKKELFDADPETLTNDELIRRSTFIELESKEAQLDLMQHQNAQFKMKQSEVKDRYTSRGRELKKTQRDQEIQQNNCTHRKGGRGAEGFLKGGTDAQYAVIRHLLPWNEWFQRCQRCGKTWKPPHRVDYPETPQGHKDYETALNEYKTALNWPSDNIPSTSITFQFHSDDGNKEAEKHVHESTKNINLR